MIPNAVATQWIEYLSTYHPTIPFCAAHERVSKISNKRVYLSSCLDKKEICSTYWKFDAIIKGNPFWAAFVFLNGTFIWQYIPFGNEHNILGGSCWLSKCWKEFVDQLFTSFSSSRNWSQSRYGDRYLLYGLYTWLLLGVTKHNQEVVIDQHIRFMDCPGIIFMSEEENQPVSLFIRNFISTQHVEVRKPLV